MANMIFTNNAATTLASGITNVATSLTVATGTGALFPNPTGGQYFYLTLQTVSGTTIEIVKCTARSTDTLTIVRAQDGTSASAFSAADKVELRVVNANLANFGNLDSTNTWAAAQTFSVQPTLTSALSIANGGTNSTATPTAGGAGYGTGTAHAYTAAGTTGQVLTSQGASAPIWSAPVVGLGGMQVFTASGTFTIPTGVTKVKAIVHGGGGNGGTGSGTGSCYSGAGAGGTGGYSIVFLSSLTPGNTITVTVGGSGGTSSISSGTQIITTCSATGGSAGGNASNTNGAGGAGSGGTLNITGMPGEGSVPVNAFAADGIPLPSIFGNSYGTGGIPSGNAGKPGIVTFEW